MTARPAARKGNGSRTKKTVAVPSRKSQPIIQMVERRSSNNIQDIPKKHGELPIPSSTFVF
ncbi:MAG TPA: hypothetical protein VLX92_17440 [Kofleriaceae bacterium]|nr:hypothetical protein [Kofleriaceae bacterium]